MDTDGFPVSSQQITTRQSRSDPRAHGRAAGRFRRPARGSRPARGTGARRVFYAAGRSVTVLLSLLFFSPVLLAFVLAFRTTAQINKNPLAIPTSLTFSSIQQAWVDGSLGPAFRNSIIVVAVAVIWLVVSGQVLAYYIVRRGDRRATVVMMYVLAGLMIPYPARVLPLYEMMTRLHLTGNLASVILFQAGSLTPLSTLLYRGFLRRLPHEYEEAALVDGARPSTILLKVVAPILRPCSAAVATLTGVLIWNDFFTPLMLVGGSNQETVPIKIYSFVGQYTTQWGEVFAGLALSALPVMVAFVVLQRYLVIGLGSGLKGLADPGFRVLMSLRPVRTTTAGICWRPCARSARRSPPGQLRRGQDLADQARDVLSGPASAWCSRC